MSEKRARAGAAGPTQDGPRKKRKRKDRPVVDRPEPTHVSQGLPKNKQALSHDARRVKFVNFASRRLEKFMDQVPRFKIKETMAELEVPLSSKKKIALEKMCEQELGPNQDPQVMSAIWLDATGKPILFYFGQRVVDQGSGETLDLSEQYKGRTQKDLDSYMENNPKADIAHDGLNEKLCRIYQLAAQALCSDMAPNLRMDRTRHEGVNVMQYDAPAQSQTHDLAANDGEDIGVDDGMKNHPAYESDLSNSGVQEYERAGVVHLVHGWIQQGQPEKGLFISGDVSRSSSSLAATGSYYALTQDVADLLAAMFKVAFPDWYSRYREAFDAGVWIPNDTGPFLGRAIIYKLQGRLHRDRHDLGPSACFGVGSYIGGAMKIPQLNAKLAYQSGDVCIFFSSILYHKVDTYFPTTQSQEEKEQKITPGRIGSVFFFPKESYEVLKDKDSGWGLRTNFGRNEALFNQV